MASCCCDCNWNKDSPYLYRLVLVSLFLGTVFYSIGFALPFWLIDVRGEHAGLWTCSRVDENISTICEALMGPNNTGHWLDTVQSLEAVGLAGLMLTWGLILALNCRIHILVSCIRLLLRLKFHSSMTFLFGWIGTIGIIIFISETMSVVPPVEVEDGRFYGCAFGFSITGCVVILACCCIFHILECPYRDDRVQRRNNGISFQIIKRYTVRHARNCPHARGDNPPQPGVDYVAQLEYMYK